MFKKQQGITLVALVITVIVLLILAGVALSMISGENGIFQKATNAANKYNQAALDEKNAMDNYVTYINTYTNGL